MDKAYLEEVKATVSKIGNLMLDRVSPNSLAATLAGTALAAKTAMTGANRDDAAVALYVAGSGFMHAAANEFDQIEDNGLAGMGAALLFAAYVLFNEEDYPNPPAKEEEVPAADDK